MPVCNKLFDLNDYSKCVLTQCLDAMIVLSTKLQYSVWIALRTGITKAIDLPNLPAEVETVTAAIPMQSLPQGSAKTIEENPKI